MSAFRTELYCLGDGCLGNAAARVLLRIQIWFLDRFHFRLLEFSLEVKESET